MMSKACLKLPYGVLVEAMSSVCPPYAILSMRIFLPGMSREGVPRDLPLPPDAVMHSTAASLSWPPLD